MSSEPQQPDPLITLIGQISNRLSADLYLYSGPVDDVQVERLLDVYPLASKKKNCALILTTYGGSPDAAFTLARFLKRKYAGGKLTLYVLGRCKSAGTLVALGADEIVMGPHGEMGPLDIQLAKEDSLSDRNSGLDIFQALLLINNQAYTFFEHQFTQLLTRTGWQVTTRTAADIATNIATQLLTPITAQVDPIRLGSMSRAVEVARRYGTLLAPHRADVVEQLITGYPSHGFVIDFEEAQALFGCVREMDDDEALMEQGLRERLHANLQVECIRAPHPVGLVDCLTKAPATQRELDLHAEHGTAQDPGEGDQPDQPNAGEVDRASAAADAADHTGAQREIHALSLAPRITAGSAES